MQPTLLRAGIALALGLLGTSLSHAQAGAACDRSAHHAAARNACAVQDFQTVDTDHTILYGNVMRTLPAHERLALRKEQSVWIRQRALDCKAAHQPDEHRDDWSARYHQCLREATQARRSLLLAWQQRGGPPVTAAH